MTETVACYTTMVGDIVAVTTADPTYAICGELIAVWHGPGAHAVVRINDACRYRIDDPADAGMTPIGVGAGIVHGAVVVAPAPEPVAQMWAGAVGDTTANPESEPETPPPAH